MKTLVVMRHAQAEQGSVHLKDHARALSPLGTYQAYQQGVRLKELLGQEFVFDRAWVSDAVRTSQTFEAVQQSVGVDHIQFDHALYMTDVFGFEAELGVLDQLGHVFVIGHNPW